MTAEGCWETPTGLNKGYSQVSIEGTSRGGHRVAYLALRGDIPNGLHLDHFYCQNKACWNPWHVEPVTMQENFARGRELRYGSRKLDPIWERQPGYSTPRVAEWREKNRDREREWNRAYREKNRDKINARTREWKRKRRQEARSAA